MVPASGTVTPALAINPATLADAAPDYNLVITNPAGAIATDPGAPGLDGQDIQAFVAYLLTPGPPTAGSCAADMNADGLHDISDVSLFINAPISS